MLKICEYCKREFNTKNKHQKCCSVECANKNKTIYRQCIVCNKTFNPERKEQKFCSMKCCHESQKKPLNSCLLCGKKFRARNKKQKYCSPLCGQIASRTIKRLNCIICGKEFIPMGERQKCCCREHAAELRMKEKGFMRNCQSPECLSASKIISKVNLGYKEFLESLGYDVELEFQLGYYSYDIKIGNILIEINPSPYHNCTRAPNDAEVKKKSYHYDKYIYAKDKGYKCIMVRDWTTNDELLKMINHKNFCYEGDMRLIRYNNKTKEHILDRGFDKTKMLSEGFVEIYDCGEPVFKKQ